MLGLAKAMTGVQEELAAVAARVDGLPAEEWRRPTDLPDWDLEAVVRHLAASAFQQAEAFHRARVGAREQPAFLAVPLSGADLVEAVRTAARHAAAATAALGEGEVTVPLPFGALPAGLAAEIMLVEQAMHRLDVEWALGDRHFPLRADLAASQVEMLPLFLTLVAAGGPGDAEGATYRLVGESGAATVTWDGTRWDAGEGGGPVCTVSGTDSAVVLFAFGRVAAGDARVTVDDPDGLVGRFKEWFPGP